MTAYRLVIYLDVMTYQARLPLPCRPLCGIGEDGPGFVVMTAKGIIHIRVKVR
jgi:hypothetical protein